MHDATLHFGDIARSWSRLNPLERGIALNLLMAYYDREGPLPLDEAKLNDLAGVEEVPFDKDKRTAARRQEQLRALHLVLNRHYQRTENGWLHARTEEEIRRYKHRCAINAHNNLKKIAKDKPWLRVPTFEDFAANISHYYDPGLKRFRNLTVDSPPPPDRTHWQTEDAPKVSDSENSAHRKTPTSGNHSPTLPPSHSPTFPLSQELTSSSSAREDTSGAPVSEAVAMKRAHDYSQGNPEMLVIEESWVRAWWSFRERDGWLRTKGMHEVPVRDWWQDLLIWCRDERLRTMNKQPSSLRPVFEKKEGAAAGAHPLERLPDFDWEATARAIAPVMGWSEAEVASLSELNWRDLAVEHRQAILNHHARQGGSPQ